MLYFQFKNKFIKFFQIWLLKIENKSNYIIKTFYTNSKKDIIFQYVTLYIHKKNSFIKKKIINNNYHKRFITF